MGAPIGNQNAARAKVWRAAIQRALDRRTESRADGIKAIDELADKLIELVASGDLPALKEFGDRMDGKPPQAIIGGDDDDPPLRIEKVERVIVHPKNPDSGSV